MASADIRFEQTGPILVAYCSGDWTVSHAADLSEAMSLPSAAGLGELVVDLTGIHNLDTTGALLIVELQRAGASQGIRSQIRGGQAAHLGLIETVDERFGDPAPPAPRLTGLVRILDNVGRWVMEIGDRSIALIGFVGLVMERLARTALRPKNFRIISMVRHMEEAGINAIPIVALIAFLVGVVFAYQGAFQLRQFGAELFVVDLLTLSILREVGVLLTAIMVAGRSGSAFTAEIGAMKVREEVDAMRTIGLNVIDVLVLPRFVALAFMLPLLTFVADISGMLGGMLMSWVELGISPGAFIGRFAEISDPWHFFTGMIKAPFFAFIIALVGCFEGLQVEGSAESVGRLTTQAVVEAVFLVIVVDGIFSVFFALVGV